MYFKHIILDATYKYYNTLDLNTKKKKTGQSNSKRGIGQKNKKKMAKEKTTEVNGILFDQ